MAFFRFKGSDNIILDVDAMPQSMFIDANSVVDVCQIKILTREQHREAGAGSPDVLVNSATNGRATITKRQLIENFTFLNGKRIRIPLLKKGKVYLVKRECFTPCKAIKIPSNAIGVHNGKLIKDKGAYVVMQVGPDGNIDRSTIKIISADNFRKMYKIPEQEIISRNRGKGHREVNCNNIRRLYKQAKNNPRPKRMVEPAFNNTATLQPQNVPTQNPFVAQVGNMSAGQNSFANAVKNTSEPARFGVGNGKPMVQLGKGGGNPFAKQQIPSANAAQAQAPTTDRYPYIATHALYNIKGDRLVGYTIKRKSDGKAIDKNIDTVKEMCAKHMIENIMLVSNNPADTSLASKYLRGNGVSLDKLPRKLMNVN